MGMSDWDMSQFDAPSTSGQGAQGAQDDPEPDDWWGPGEKGDPDWHGGPDLDYSEEEISIHEPWENPEESWYNKFISGIPKFGLSAAKDIGKTAVTSINPLMGLVAYFGPEIMDLLGIKSREEEIEAAIKAAEKYYNEAFNNMKSLLEPDLNGIFAKRFFNSTMTQLGIVDKNSVKIFASYDLDPVTKEITFGDRTMIPTSWVVKMTKIV